VGYSSWEFSFFNGVCVFTNFGQETPGGSKLAGHTHTAYKGHNREQDRYGNTKEQYDGGGGAALLDFSFLYLLPFFSVPQKQGASAKDKKYCQSDPANVSHGMGD
jgi:hypothetical protein